ncbi:hypothetical protein MUN89_02285 [Halobacillus salinarum]|uniref:Uncharacterized protein n=1 Tax=Halobacillus salinarum TaxID=2932257 RepID=A0ABY4EL23_9BACI|nr:hypothetical protein [Halobacillus salinarum]UOQ44803.1 hypothetical protein MUN89_02285 [Halobacillus salinarum]
MKKNTGCSNNYKCPAQLPSNKAKTKSVNCEVIDASLDLTGEIPSAVDIPVALADVILEADVEADIHLPTPAREIKWIRKNISLKQCKAVPSILDLQNLTVKIFVTGVIHKNIQYVEDTTGFIRDYGVDVAFTCSETVELENPIQYPVLGVPFSVKSSVLERRELAYDGHGADLCTDGSLTFEIYNEPISCKLIASAVNEIDLHKDFDSWGRFSKITEKAEVILVFKLLQTQQIATNVDNGMTAEGETQASQPKYPTASERFKNVIRRVR